MPRIFQVTLTKEIQVDIVADSLEELESALAADSGEFDTWAENEDWDVRVEDTLKVAHPEMIPKEFAEPDMGVLKNSCVDVYDYKRLHPGYLEKVNADALEVARRLTAAKHNLRLPFPTVQDETHLSLVPKSP